MKIALSKKWNRARAGSILIVDPWKMREMKEEGYCTGEYTGPLVPGENLLDQEAHDKAVAAAITAAKEQAAKDKPKAKKKPGKQLPPE